MFEKFQGLIEWYRWLLKFNVFKYIALLFMTAGPLYFIYRMFFLNMAQTTVFIYSLISFTIGIIIWVIVWDPYS